ncbi:MAG: hypothetical protein Q4P05_07660 [Actinomycetaceae bacterium]|nr:hypothetical protein [Actinomycetaceae bacterium]
MRLEIFAVTSAVSFLLACAPVAMREYLVGRWLQATMWGLIGVGSASASVWAAVETAVTVDDELMVIVGIPRGLLIILAVISALWAASRPPAIWPHSGVHVSPAQWYRVLRRILTGFYGWSGEAADEAVAVIRDQMKNSTARAPSDLASDDSILVHPAALYGEAWEVAADFTADSPPASSRICTSIFLNRLWIPLHRRRPPHDRP